MWIQFFLLDYTSVGCPKLPCRLSSCGLQSSAPPGAEDLVVCLLVASVGSDADSHTFHPHFVGHLFSYTDQAQSCRPGAVLPQILCNEWSCLHCAPFMLCALHAPLQGLSPASQECVQFKGHRLAVMFLELSRLGSPHLISTSGGLSGVCSFHGKKLKSRWRVLPHVIL